MSLRALAGILFLALAQPLLAGEAAAPVDAGHEAGHEAALRQLAFVDAAIADGRLKGAQDLLARARALNDGPHHALREAEILLASGAHAAALRLFDMLESEPDLAARALLGRGLAEYRAGRAAEAEAALGRAVAIDPSLMRGWLALAALADQRQDWAAAEAHHGRALELDPRSATALNNRGWSRLLQGRHADAEADLAQALSLDAGLAAARTNLRLARAMQGRYAEAFEGTDRAGLARDLNTVGFAAMTRGDHALAESYFARALELNTRYDRAAAANLAYLQEIRMRPAKGGLTASQ